MVAYLQNKEISLVQKHIISCSKSILFHAPQSCYVMSTGRPFDHVLLMITSNIYLFILKYFQVQETARSIIQNLDSDHSTEETSLPVTSPPGGSTSVDKAADKWSMAFCEFYRDNQNYFYTKCVLNYVSEILNMCWYSGNSSFHVLGTDIMLRDLNQMHRNSLNIFKFVKNKNTPF